jgi:hypothetical protein
MSEKVSHTPTYRLTCPYCNGALYPNAFTPESAPWLCSICKHSWWAAELSEKARKQFRPNLCDFGYGQLLEDLQNEVLAERDEARIRGTSVRLDQLQLLPAIGLKQLPQVGKFGDYVKLEIKRKGV